jgi:hypothetical protein
MTHGTITAYRNHGCRCEECRATQAAYNRRNRATRLDTGSLSHGTRSAYDAGCRCDECRLARSIAYRVVTTEYKAKKIQPEHLMTLARRTGRA